MISRAPELPERVIDPGCRQSIPWARRKTQRARKPSRDSLSKEHASSNAICSSHFFSNYPASTIDISLRNKLGIVSAFDGRNTIGRECVTAMLAETFEAAVNVQLRKRGGNDGFRQNNFKREARGGVCQVRPSESRGKKPLCPMWLAYLYHLPFLRTLECAVRGPLRSLWSPVASFVMEPGAETAFRQPDQDYPLPNRFADFRCSARLQGHRLSGRIQAAELSGKSLTFPAREPLLTGLSLLELRICGDGCSHQ